MKRSVLAVGLVLAAVSIAAQAPSSTGSSSSPGKYTVSRTADGVPDLQGTWTTATYTPLERPARYAGKEFLTQQEFEELTRLLKQPGVDPLVTNIFGATDEQRKARVEQNDPTHYDNNMWLATADAKALSSLRTSLIIDPPDGKLPPPAPGARGRGGRIPANYDSYENRPLQERCIIWTHEGPPMMPPPYNDILQIIQTPGYVIVYRELATAPRMIPTDGSMHLPATITRWAGDSRGRWEGDTLVVETTNFNDKTTFQGSSSYMRVVERFTRVSADRIVYQFTVDDPNTWTRPWTAELPMLQTTGNNYEYACHEGNRGLPNILSGARFTEKEGGTPGVGRGAPAAGRGAPPAGRGIPPTGR